MMIEGKDSTLRLKNVMVGEVWIGSGQSNMAMTVAESANAEHEIFGASFENIITFIDRPLTNAVGEGINRIIKLVKNRPSGFRNLESFSDLIFLSVGDLDIPAQIPTQLRTL